ncbi:MAG TPA: succinate dehydrogenase, cytochrome b556 subunit [Roseiarcus sp.]|jgi:succinate dehydrogenase / fumarate reductase cytochrome b subunit|nr:succinate dehydrogenase, cytochrome b556 subunit [Roseiarcus sp.]
MASSDALPGSRRPRPLSPHLSIYRLTMTMAMSIAHRISGVALYFGVLVLAWFLIAASADASAFSVFSEFIGSFIGRVVLFVVTWALFHHLVGGFRHIIWDAGYGLDAPLRDQMAWATLIGGVALTVLVWIIGLAIR